MGKQHSKAAKIDPKLLKQRRTSKGDEFVFGDIAILGAEKVGKTSMVHRFVHNYFTEIYEPTSGMHRYEVVVLVATDAKEGQSLIFRNDFKKSITGKEKLKSIHPKGRNEATSESTTDSNADYQYRTNNSPAYDAAYAKGIPRLRFNLVDMNSDIVDMEPTAYRATLTNAKGFILVCSFDVEESLSYIEERFRDIQRVNSKTPIIIVANKFDLPEEQKVLDEEKVAKLASELHHNYSVASLSSEEGCAAMMQAMSSEIHMFAEQENFDRRLPEEYAY